MCIHPAPWLAVQNVMFVSQRDSQSSFFAPNETLFVLELKVLEKLLQFLSFGIKIHKSLFKNTTELCDSICQ